MKLVFMGTPQYAAKILSRMLEAGLVPGLVVTQPDRGAGRNLQPTPPPVKIVAEQAKIPVIQPEKITVAVREQLAAYQPDIMVVAAYGKILRPAVLTIPPLGCINAHASLLPAYRGAAPVNWALVDGAIETGITIMKMDEGIDTGAILATRKIGIDPRDNAGTLLEKLTDVAAELLVETFVPYVEGKIVAQPQPEEGATYAPQLRKEDGVIDWRKTATEVVNHIRAMTPWPGAYTFWHGRMIKVMQAEPGHGEGEPGTVVRAKKELVVAVRDGAVRLLTLQLQGKKAMDATAFLNGVRITEGEWLEPDQSG